MKASARRHFDDNGSRVGLRGSSAFTGELASEIYYAIGSESMGSTSNGEKDSESNKDDEVALNAFEIANVFACLGQDASKECRGHGKSLSRIARLTLDGDAKASLRYASAALTSSDIDDETKIEAHVVAGQAKMVCNYRFFCQAPLFEA